MVGGGGKVSALESLRDGCLFDCDLTAVRADKDVIDISVRSMRRKRKSHGRQESPRFLQQSHWFAVREAVEVSSKERNIGEKQEQNCISTTHNIKKSKNNKKEKNFA